MHTIIKFLLPIISVLSSFLLVAQSQKSVIDFNDSTSIEIEVIPFDSSGRKLQFHERQFLYAIDGVPVYGTDGNIPILEVKQIKFIVGKKVYVLQSNYMFDPWFKNGMNKNSLKYIPNGSQHIVQGVFSDGAGSYFTEWVIEKEATIRTVLSKDERMMGLFYD